ncbi:MAG TPA: M90 family metallopeptidase [Pedobacter sp.]|jgi:hypothetical protein
MLIAALILVAALVLFFVLKKPGAGNVKNPELPKHMTSLLNEHISFYRKLDQEEKIKFEQKVSNFIGKVNIEGVGTEIEDVDRILVAASAIIPIFKFGNWEYRNLTSVTLYPDTFNQDFQFEGEDRSVLGVVGTGFMHRQMILSKNALTEGFRIDSDARNTAIHEFVHLLDMADGDADGVPELLLDSACFSPWIKAIQKEMKRIEKGNSDIDPYALTNDAEFLAVVSEYFFEKPEKMKRRYPELYSFADRMYNKGVG